MNKAPIIVIANRRQKDEPSNVFVLGHFGMESKGNNAHYISRIEVKRVLDSLRTRGALPEETKFRGSYRYNGVNHDISEHSWPLRTHRCQLHFGCKKFNQRDSALIWRWADRAAIGA